MLAASEQAATVILMHGGDRPHPQDFLIRNNRAFQMAGFTTFVVSTPSEAARRTAEARRGGPVYVVAMSKGVIRATAAMGSGMQVDAAVFVSGNYRRAIRNLATPAQLPRTLLIHHRQDGCRGTTPANVPTFLRWSRGKSSVAWFDNTGAPGRGGPCGPLDAHGFYREDAAPVAAAIEFLRRH